MKKGYEKETQTAIGSRGPVLDISDLLKSELNGDIVQSFHTRCDGTIIAMQKQLDEELLGNLYFRQHVPADKLVVSSMIGLRKEKEETTDKEGQSPSPKLKSSDTDDMKRKSSDTDGKETGTSPSAATEKPLCFKF